MWGATGSSADAALAREDFNPRAPCGARHYDLSEADGNLKISIHAPRVGRDCERRVVGERRLISIHAPRVGRDGHLEMLRGMIPTFQSTRPVWGATVWVPIERNVKSFQSTRPVWGATVPVYTGLITAGALYFSRTSFLAVLLQAFFVAKSSV